MLLQEQMRIVEQQREISALRETLQAEVERREKEVVEEVRKLNQDEVERSLELARVKAALATREDALTITLDALRQIREAADIERGNPSVGPEWESIHRIAFIALGQINELLGGEADG
ncbi:MAG: hypothetical protein JXA37_12960 [Chloroflexia bacterium]|nr:hypothetical protein [Chloroflexia bacterium]